MAQGGSVRRAAISERAFGNPLSHNYGSGAEANLAPAPSDCAGLRAGLGRGVLSVGRMAVQPAQSFAGVGGTGFSLFFLFSPLVHLLYPLAKFPPPGAPPYFH